MAEISSEFVFCLCQEGVERVLRAELTSLGFSPSFQAKGFVTAKAKTPLTLSTLPRPVLARRTCLSLGKDIDVARVAADLGARVHDVAAVDRGGDAVLNEVVTVQ